MENLKQLTLITFILLIIFYPFLILFSPMKIEIVPVKTQMQAYIYKRTMLNPFHKVFIPNVKRAVTTETKTSNGRFKYRLELEDFQGNRYPVTSYEDSDYNSEITIETKINNSIKNRTLFKHTISSHYLITVILFIIFLIAGSIRAKNYKRRFGIPD